MYIRPMPTFAVERTDTIFEGGEKRDIGRRYGTTTRLFFCNAIIKCEKPLLRDAMIRYGKQIIHVVHRYKNSAVEYAVIIN